MGVLVSSGVCVVYVSPLLTKGDGENNSVSELIVYREGGGVSESVKSIADCRVRSVIMYIDQFHLFFNNPCFCTHLYPCTE